MLAKTEAARAARPLVLTLSLALAAPLAGCEVARRAYLSATKQVVRNTTVAMLPTVKAGQYVVIDRDYYTSHPIRRFDLVIVRDPAGTKSTTGADTFFLKRVVALGGETVEVRGRTLYVNQAPLPQPFSTIPHEPSEEFGPYLIPQGEYFLMGDNRPNSADSRHWRGHSVDKSLIHAKAVEIVSE
jgi:signal peptidase I